MTIGTADVQTKNPVTALRRKKYYDEAATWAADIHGSLRASRRIAWIVASCATIIALLEALALVALAPLKTVVPYTITVDRQTGYVETVSGLQPGPLTQDQAVTQSYLVQYVIARETFDATDLRDQYHKVMLWSAGDSRDEYQQLMQQTTPNSPLNLYSPTTMVTTTIKSVSMLSPTTALVRFDTTRHDSGSTTGSQQSWAAAIAFRYTNAPISMGERFVHPLGIQVTRYRRDAEALSPSSVPLPSTAVGAATTSPRGTPP
jgi:type IV secretion system protein VirB8